MLYLFLIEYEVVGVILKCVLSCKGKNKDIRVNKFVINLFLILLDWDFVMESLVVMMYFVDLLNWVILFLLIFECCW